ncbi:dynein light chain binding protein [Aureococcus anophagefferens]|nr:dynein light chain binding protein [Aureococcus anophagefferens]
MNAIRMVWIISRHYNTDLRPPRRRSNPGRCPRGAHASPTPGAAADRAPRQPRARTRPRAAQAWSRHGAAYKIAEKVETEVNIKTILRRSPEQAKKVIKEAQTVLNSWESTYMSVRQRIEESGTHIRWEFDWKRLFELTKYMAHAAATS